LTRDDERADEDDDGGNYVPTVADTLTRWRYTLTPTLYVNEESSTGELLWQQVLEQRAIRAWLVVIWLTLVVVCGLALIATLVIVAVNR
jgi:hypothetical protein